MRASYDSIDMCSDAPRLVGACALLAICSLWAVGCSSDAKKSPTKAKAGDSCQVTADCKKPLRCREGTCKAPPDGGTVEDTGPGNGGSADAGSTLEAENYYISYLVSDVASSDNNRKLKLYSTEDRDETVVNPDSVECTPQQQCWVTEDLSTFVYTDSVSTTRTDVYTAEIGGDLTAAGEGDVLLEGVRNVTLQGNHLVYARNTGSNETAIHYRKLPDGNEQTFTKISGDKDWFVDPEHNAAAIYDYSRTGERPFQVGPLDNWRESVEVESISAKDYKGTATGLLGDVGDTTVSRDGRLMAFYINRTVNQYGPCERSDPAEPYAIENNACGPSEYGFRCDEAGRCSRREATVYLVDLNPQFRNKLGQNCSSADECGPYQKCYIPNNNVDRSKCLPGQITAGAITQGSGRFPGCSIAEADPLVDFGGSSNDATFSGDLSFDGDKNLYVVANRDRSCLQQNFENDRSSQIVRLDPEKRTSFELSDRKAENIAYQPIEGMAPDQSFSQSDCIDDAQGVTVEGCRVFVQEARLSPNGQELAYSGTIPNASSGQAREELYLWHMLRDGSERWFTGTEQTRFKNVTNIRVHAGP